MGAPPTTTCRNTHLLHIALAKGIRTKSGTSPHLCGQKRNQLIKFAHTSIQHNRIIGCRFAEHSSAQNKIDVAALFDRSHSRTPTEWFKSMVSMINSYAHKYIVSQILHLSTAFLQTDAMFSFFFTVLRTSISHGNPRTNIAYTQAHVRHKNPSYPHLIFMSHSV